jgi:Fe-S-cluster containining protein
MLLSEADIRRLKEAGHDPRKFVHVNRQSLPQLRNRRGHCVFYNIKRKICNVYRYRPLGCRIYPVIYSEEEGVIIDEFCPLASTVSATEVKHKTKRLVELLQAIDSEPRYPDSSSEARSSLHKSGKQS